MVEKARKHMNDIGFNTLMTFVMGLITISTFVGGLVLGVVRPLSELRVKQVEIQKDVSESLSKIATIEKFGSPQVGQHEIRIKAIEKCADTIQDDVKSLGRRVDVVERKIEVHENKFSSSNKSADPNSNGG